MYLFGQDSEVPLSWIAERLETREETLRNVVRRVDSMGNSEDGGVVFTLGYDLKETKCNEYPEDWTNFVEVN